MDVIGKFHVCMYLLNKYYLPLGSPKMVRGFLSSKIFALWLENRRLQVIEVDKRKSFKSGSPSFYRIQLVGSSTTWMSLYFLFSWTTVGGGFVTWMCTLVISWHLQRLLLEQHLLLAHSKGNEHRKKNLSGVTHLLLKCRNENSLLAYGYTLNIANYLVPWELIISVPSSPRRDSGSQRAVTWAANKQTCFRELLMES